MAYNHLIGKVVRVIDNYFTFDVGKCFIFKVESVSADSDIITFTTDCYIQIGSHPDAWVYREGEATLKFYIKQNNVTVASKEILDHCRNLLQDTPKYYKLIGQELTMEALKEVELEEFKKIFPSYVPPAPTLCNIEKDKKLLRNAKENIDRLENKQSPHNSLIVNKQQVKLSFL